MLCWRFPALCNIGSHLPFTNGNTGTVELIMRMQFRWVLFVLTAEQFTVCCAYCVLCLKSSSLWQTIVRIGLLDVMSNADVPTYWCAGMRGDYEPTWQWISCLLPTATPTSRQTILSELRVQPSLLPPRSSRQLCLMPLTQTSILYRPHRLTSPLHCTTWASTMGSVTSWLTRWRSGREVRGSHPGRGTILGLLGSTFGQVVCPHCRCLSSLLSSKNEFISYEFICLLKFSETWYFLYLISKLRRIYIPSRKLVILYSQHFSISNQMCRKRFTVKSRCGIGTTLLLLNNIEVIYDLSNAVGSMNELNDVSRSQRWALFKSLHFYIDQIPCNVPLTRHARSPSDSRASCYNLVHARYHRIILDE